MAFCTSLMLADRFALLSRSSTCSRRSSMAVGGGGGGRELRAAVAGYEAAMVGVERAAGCSEE